MTLIVAADAPEAMVPVPALRVQTISFEQVNAPRVSGPTAVSYTHLDVYKRQILSWDQVVELVVARVAGVRISAGLLTRNFHTV